MAQNLALKAAGYELVMRIPITTKQFSNDWPGNLLYPLTGQESIIISYSNILKDNGFFNLMYRIESFFQYLKSITYTFNGLAFVYSDDNVIFRKSKYFGLGGFGKNITEPYANLELVINSFIRKKECVIHFNTDTCIRREEKISNDQFNELLHKSFRIENKLSFGKKVMLIFDNITKVIFLPFLAVVAILFLPLWPVFSVLTIIFVVTYCIILGIVQKRLGESGIFVPSLLYDLIRPWLKIVYRWYFGQKSRKQKWMSRL
jgi:hypothetical protein